MLIISRSLRSLGQFLLCVWKLQEVESSKPRILQLNCLFNNYNVVIPRSLLLNTISMLKTNNFVQFEPIPTLYSEVTPKISKRAFHNLFIII